MIPLEDDDRFLERVKQTASYVAIKLPIERCYYGQLKKLLSRKPLGVCKNHRSGHYHEYTVKHGLSLVGKHFDILNYFPYNILADKDAYLANLRASSGIRGRYPALDTLWRIPYMILPLTTYVTLFGGNLFIFAKS